MANRLALAQLAPILGEVDLNLEQVVRWARRAAHEGASLVVFPELALTGYVLRDLVPEVAMRQDDARLAAVSRAAPGVTLVVGFVEETRDFRFANSVVALRDGQRLGLHRKLYLPTYGLFDEGRFTRPGDRIRSVDLGALGIAGLSVCEDFWHPFVPMLQAADGARLLINVSAGPARAPGSAAGTAALDAWAKLLETHALANGVAVAYCNRVGNEEGLTFWGGSRLVGADGAVRAQAPLYNDHLLVTSLPGGSGRGGRRPSGGLVDVRLDLLARELDRLIAQRAGWPPTHTDGGRRLA